MIEIIYNHRMPLRDSAIRITYRQVDLLEDGTFDYENIRKAINEKTKLVEIQRSKGYMTRPSFSVKQIGELIAFVKSIKPVSYTHLGSLFSSVKAISLSGAADKSRAE